MIEIQVIRKAKTVQVPESDVIPLVKLRRNLSAVCKPLVRL